MDMINPNFNKSASPESQTAAFEAAYDGFFLKLRKIAAPAKNLDEVEPQIRLAFQDFLKKMDYPLALKNFDALLKEKSGDKFKRDDGSVNWYHEFIPILIKMAIIRKGKKEGTAFEDVESYGGLEAWIAAHLRHDSVEDHTKMRKFSSEQRAMPGQIKAKNAAYDMDAAHAQVRTTLNITNLMTQNVTTMPDGTQIKEHVVKYTHRMVASPKATPLAFISKQGDGVHNSATLFGAPKFEPPPKRLKRCNDQEDMYGPRYGFPDRAMMKWPEFANGIGILDAMMGTLLYPHFRYLQNVDLHYKTPDQYPIWGIARYLKKALSVEFPDDKFNPIHIGFKRMMASVDPIKDPDKYERLMQFKQNCLKPVLVEYREHFPYLFETSGHKPIPAPSPVAN